ncbi:MAG: hypothetical protein RI947_77 [Candidatus Parcubacteria bacterium]|jgi:hypothetical protein
MNPTDSLTTQLADIVHKGSAGVVLLPANPTIDALASATAIYLGLTKKGKNVTLACANVPENDLIGADKIQNAIATKGDNLIISFPYTEGSIDKVDYNIQGSQFNLIITPREGQPKLDASKVQYSYAGGKIDFIITVDTPNLSNLGPLYTENQQEFQGKPIINIDRHLINGMYGTVNFVIKTSSSTSELAIKVLQILGCEIDKDIATNLYTGLTAATNFFSSYSVNAETFETAANLLKQGAVKKNPARQQANTQQSQTQNQPQAQVQAQPQAQPNQQPAQQAQPQQERRSFMRPPQNPFRQQPKNQSQPQAQPNQQPAQQAQPQQQAPAATPLPANENAKEGQTPQDWLKPKIFRGGGLV